MNEVLIPAWFESLIAGTFGLIAGSFINVVVHRLPQRKSLIEPGSQCPFCKNSIRWYDNLPVLSYLFLFGKCRKCHRKISLRYPIIELLVCLLFIASVTKFGLGPLTFLRDWPFLASLVAVTFIDLEHRIIPDEISLGGLVLGLLTCYWVPGLGLINGFVGAAFGFSVFYLFAWIYFKMSGKSGLGGGDIKLLAMIGAFLGPSGVFSTILMSSVLGSVMGILYALTRKQRNVLKVAIPYGPFLVLGALYYYFFGDLLWLRFMTPT